MRRETIVVLAVAIAAVVCVGTFAYLDSGVPDRSLPAPQIALTPAACGGTDPRVADPSGVHGLFVLDPPTAGNGSLFSAVEQYLIPSPVDCGVDFWVHWDSVDRGPGAVPRYDWSSVLDEMAPWVAAGKEVNLIFWAVGYGPNTTYVPPAVLAAVGTVQCGDSPVTPYYWETPYVQNYTAFMRAAVEEFADNASIGYLRFGLGTGGETFPLYDINAPGCDAALNATGFTVPLWDSYLESMIDFEASLGSPHLLTVALDGGLFGPSDHTFADIAEWASAEGLGFGSEAVTAASVERNAAGDPVCTNGAFCSLFDRYEGDVPLEIQTQGPSSPSGAPPIGSLVPILNYTLAMHTQIFELYWEDWLIAFDPGYPGFPSYGSAYAGALDTVAAAVG